jgi:hypothetical protein
MAEWRQQLDGFFAKGIQPTPEKEVSDFSRFIADVVMPALEEVAPELEKHGRSVVIRNSVTSAAMIIHLGGEEEMTYRVHRRRYPNKVLPYAEIRCRERSGLRYVTVESMFRSGSSTYKLADITKEEIIQNFLENYTRRIAKA